MRCRSPSSSTRASTSASSATRRGPTAPSGRSVVAAHDPGDPPRPRAACSARASARSGGCDSAESVDAATIERQPLWTDRRDDTGPFDIIGDVHGCADELRGAARRARLRASTGQDGRRAPGRRSRRPTGRKAIFVGDLVDRGPRTPDVLRIAMAHGRRPAPPMSSWATTTASWRAGWTAGTSRSATACSSRSTSWPARAEAFRDDGRSLPRRPAQPLLARRRPARGRPCRPEGGDDRPRLAARCASSPSTARPPARSTSSACRSARDWAADYRGQTAVVYGHTPVLEAGMGQQHHLHRHRLRLRRQADGAALAGEGRWSSVPAERVWYEPIRPLAPPRRRAVGPGRGRRPARHGGRHRPALDRHRRCAAASWSPRRTRPPRWR